MDWLVGLFSERMGERRVQTAIRGQTLKNRSSSHVGLGVQEEGRCERVAGKKGGVVVVGWYIGAFRTGR